MHTMMTALLLLLLQAQHSRAFTPNALIRGHQMRIAVDSVFSAPSDVEMPPSSAVVNEIKERLVRLCQTRATAKPESSQVRELVTELQREAELYGIGQASAVSGLLPGEWDLVYSAEDDTRSSPFFWAFRKAFPDNSDQIFGITDAIPAPIKEVGPATQEIKWNGSTGSLVSRVKVATLGGLASSIMTTRCSILGSDSVDGLRLKIDTTKPEDSSVVSTLFGPLGDAINSNAPPFPSGEALERIAPGSSELIMRTTFCDENLRVSRNDERPGDIFIWQRKSFAVFDEL